MTTKNRTCKRSSERTYLRTHPWIKFAVDVNDCPETFWGLLGEIKSKCEQVANALLPPDIREKMLLVYLARGIHATTAIEGNTLSEGDVLDVIAQRDTIPPSQEYQKIEVQNIIDACNWIGDEIFDGGHPVELSTDLIKKFNRKVLQDLPLEDPRIVPGEIFPHQVMVANYKGAPRGECEFLLDRLCEWINHLKPKSPELAMEYSFIKAVLSHLYVAWIHPFGDGNGRVARLIELQILCGAGVPNYAAHLLSNHYNLTRTEYYRKLSNSSLSGGDVIPFMEYAFRGFLDEIKDQINVIQWHQMEVAWKDHVYRVFRDESGPAARRRRQVALDLWGYDEYIPASRIRRLTPAVAEMYAGKTQKTISRDLNFLARKRLVSRSERMVMGNFELLGRMFPRRRRPDDK